MLRRMVSTYPRNIQAGRFRSPEACRRVGCVRRRRRVEVRGPGGVYFKYGTGGIVGSALTLGVMRIDAPHPVDCVVIVVNGGFERVRGDAEHPFVVLL